MTREAEHFYTTDPSVIYYAYTRSSVPGDPCASTSIWSMKGPYSVSGGTRKYGRDGSHETVMVNGWREPTPYWGYHFVTKDVALMNSMPYYGGSTIQWGNNCPIYALRTYPSGVDFTTFRPTDASLQSQAITAALAELGSATAELGVELREAHKTAAFIGKTLGDLAQAAWDLRRGKIPPDWKRKWRKWSGDIPRSFDRTFCNRWLEYRYAWSPLILGVHDSLALLEKRSQERLWVQTVRKRAERVDSESTSWLYNQNIGSAYALKADIETVVCDKTSVYVVLSFTPRDGLMTLNDAGVMNPATVAWEVVPFSFVADWFLGVGDYLNALSALAAWSFKGGTATTYKEWGTQRIYHWMPSGSNGFCVAPSAITAKAGGHSFNRVVLSAGDLTPGLHVGKGLNLVRSLDSISLMYSLLRGKNIKGLRV